jgi:hypothetical protein
VPPTPTSIPSKPLKHRCQQAFFPIVLLDLQILKLDSTSQVKSMCSYKPYESEHLSKPEAIASVRVKIGFSVIPFLMTITH